MAVGKYDQPLIGQLWLCHSADDEKALAISQSLEIPIIPFYASDLAFPELLVGPYRLVGVVQMERAIATVKQFSTR
jgi:hypothetical protein